MFSYEKITPQSVFIRDETIWRYIDTVSIRRLTIRIVAQRDISRYDLDICSQVMSSRCLYFLYLTRFRICLRNIISESVVCVKCLLKWTFKWTFLHLQWLKIVKSYKIEKMFLTFKLPQSSQTFYCLVIIYFAISSQIPRISNLTLYTYC